MGSKGNPGLNYKTLRLLVSGSPLKLIHLLSLSPSLSDRTVKIWDLTSGQEVLTLDKHFSYVRCVSYCSRNRLIFTASQSLIKVSFLPPPSPFPSLFPFSPPSPFVSLLCTSIGVSVPLIMCALGLVCG